MARNSKLILTASQARKIDVYARESLGVPVSILMENAGRSVAEEALRVLGKKSRVAVFCGKGNNGGDGFVAARHLLAKGITPDIFLTAKLSEVKAEARRNLNILLNLGCDIKKIDSDKSALLQYNNIRYDIIIDAILGTGAKSEVTGTLKRLVAAINHAKSYILSIDIPSGLDATTGRVLGCCIHADQTITFIAKKKAMISRNGKKYCGQVKVVDLGVPV